MLNSNLVKLTEALNKLCVDGYNTIDKSDIFACLENDFNTKWSVETLTEEIKTLIDNKFIIVKYQDDEVYCLSFTEAGKELINRINIAKQNEQKIKKSGKKEQIVNNSQVVATSYDLNVPSSQNEIMSGLINAGACGAKNYSKLKNFFYSFIGGLIGGGVSGAIIALIVILV